MHKLSRAIQNPLVAIMFLASSATFFLSQYVDAGIVMGVVLLSVFLGLLQEKLASREINTVLTAVQVILDQESLDISIE